MADALPANQTSAYARLTRRQKRFVEHFAAGCTGSEAIRQAGYKGKYAHVVAHKWANRPEVRAAIQEREEQLTRDLGIRQHVVMRQMLAIATCDPRKVVDPQTGQALPLEQLDPETAAAISSVEVENISINGESGTRYKYRFWDKVKANDRLGQFTKLWDAKSGTSINVDARSVHIGGNAAGEGFLRAADDLLARAAAVGVAPALPAPGADGSVLPASVCDGQAGHRAPVDAGENPRGAE
jgi:phage terminase small subunit